MRKLWPGWPYQNQQKVPSPNFLIIFSFPLFFIAPSFHRLGRLFFTPLWDEIVLTQVTITQALSYAERDYEARGGLQQFSFHYGHSSSVNYFSSTSPRPLTRSMGILALGTALMRGASNSIGLCCTATAFRPRKTHASSVRAIERTLACARRSYRWLLGVEVVLFEHYT